MQISKSQRRDILDAVGIIIKIDKGLNELKFKINSSTTNLVDLWHKLIYSSISIHLKRENVV